MPNPEKTVTRRSFTAGVAAAAATVLIPGSDALAQSAQPSDAMAKLSPEARAEVEAKFNDLVRKYGSRLAVEQKTDIHRILAETQDGLEKMRKFVVENGDQPATVLQLYGTKEQ